MKHNPPARDQERPEVEASASLEGHEDGNVELQDIIPSYGEKGSNGHPLGKIVVDLLASFAIAIRVRIIDEHGVEPNLRDIRKMPMYSVEIEQDKSEQPSTELGRAPLIRKGQDLIRSKVRVTSDIASCLS